jgi:mono/diheme cytochrome c family protein
MKKTIVSAAIFGLVLLFGAGFYVASGGYDMAADTPHWAITGKVLEVVRDSSIGLRARNIELPDLSDEQLILKGAGQYAAMCVNCHLAPGQENSEIRPGLYPQPPKLSEQRFGPKTVFWVTKHGLKMSGMPAWGVGHDDATLWSIVAFVNKLPGMSAAQYKDIVARAPPDEEMGSMKMEEGEKSSQSEKSGLKKSTEPKGEHKH